MKIWEAIEKFFLKLARKIKLGKLADLYESHLEGMRYLICGALSTLVNIIGYAVGAYVIFSGITDNVLRVNISDIFAFILALIFAYVVNKIIVFQSKCETKKDLFKEIVSFTSCRIFTQIISLGMMNLAVIINMNDIIMKIIANVVVIILNFILSKLIIFKKKENNL